MRTNKLVGVMRRVLSARCECCAVVHLMDGMHAMRTVPVCILIAFMDLAG